ncbi:MAG: bifunctional methylenetetrahydrofolate dehydrogenase/methenyltetrahydrofolate cyclohydrolase [Armatimonadetes bacterium]|nr:bifunctional methylenetetrahydrofolate dehydrogenase/methenyltetrahydrofolate cyclohydrolase [Armatimonadota bacterium]
MEPIILDGTRTARAIREELKEETRALTERGVEPTLAVVLAGDDPASATYVSMKQKACAQTGVRSEAYALPASASQQEIIDTIASLNARPEVDGILVQHPLPKGLDEMAVMTSIAPGKDVDGVSLASFGALALGVAQYASCTASGIIELLDRYNLPIQGRHTVVVGRSIIVGKPAMLLFLQRNATVTVCHTRTHDLAHHTRQADILVAAAGQPEMITGDMIQRGAVVIDAGCNRIEGRKGDVGDVHFESASRSAFAITPVPGGVGPMTIAMLLRNTIRSAQGRACG